jgi:hypothetical protein
MISLTWLDQCSPRSSAIQLCHKMWRSLTNQLKCA